MAKCSADIETVEFNSRGSRGLAVPRKILFGSSGLPSVSVPVGIVMMIISLLLVIVTLGPSIFLTWPNCVIWALVAPGTTRGTVTTHATS